MPAVTADLTETYQFLRTIEHRLQMIADEQTQTLPDDDEYNTVAGLMIERFGRILDRFL